MRPGVVEAKARGQSAGVFDMECKHMQRRTIGFLTSVFLLLLLQMGAVCDGNGLSTPALPGPADDCDRPINADELKVTILQLVNIERAAFNLDPLWEHDLLESAADDYACKLIQDRYFDHVDPVTGEGPGERVITSGYAYLSVGENLAAGQMTPEQVIVEWMNSPSHRDNILAPNWTEAGVGVRLGGQYDIYWVMVFADPLVF